MQKVSFFVSKAKILLIFFFYLGEINQSYLRNKVILSKSYELFSFYLAYISFLLENNSISIMKI